MRGQVLLTAALLAGGAVPAAAQASFGPQLSYGTVSDIGAGVRAFVPLRTPTATAAVDYFFGDEAPDADVTWVDLHGGLTLPLGLDPSWGGDAYAGAALGVSLVTETPADEVGAGDTDIFPGLNILAGWRAATGDVAAFVEVRGVIGAAGQVVFTGGLTFGGGR